MENGSIVRHFGTGTHDGNRAKAGLAVEVTDIISLSDITRSEPIHLNQTPLLRGPHNPNNVRLT